MCLEFLTDIPTLQEKWGGGGEARKGGRVGQLGIATGRAPAYLMEGMGLVYGNAPVEYSASCYIFMDNVCCTQTNAFIIHFCKWIATNTHMLQ